MMAPDSPWQNGFAERLIGSIRRECVDHIIVLGERHLRQVLKYHVLYYNESRTHLSLDSVLFRSAAALPPFLFLVDYITAGFEFSTGTVAFFVQNMGRTCFRFDLLGQQTRPHEPD